MDFQFEIQRLTPLSWIPILVAHNNMQVRYVTENQESLFYIESSFVAINVTLSRQILRARQPVQSVPLDFTTLPLCEAVYTTCTLEPSDGDDFIAREIRNKWTNRGMHVIT